MTSSRGTDGKNSCALTCGDLSHPVLSREGLIFCPTLPSSVVFTQLDTSFPAKFMNIFALSFCAYDHLFPSLPHPPSLSLLSLPPSLSLPLYALPTLSPSLLLPQSLTLSASPSLSPPYLPLFTSSPSTSTGAAWPSKKWMKPSKTPCWTLPHRGGYSYGTPGIPRIHFILT
jgi:hypothetical protein